MQGITQRLADRASERAWRRGVLSIALASTIVLALPAMAQAAANDVVVDLGALDGGDLSAADLLVPPVGVTRGPANARQRIILKPPVGTPRYVPGKIKPIKLSFHGLSADASCTCPPKVVRKKHRVSKSAPHVSPANAVAPTATPAPAPKPAAAPVAPPPAPKAAAPAPAPKPAPKSAAVTPVPAPPPAAKPAVAPPPAPPKTASAPPPVALPAAPPPAAKPAQTANALPPPQVLTPPPRPAATPAPAAPQAAAPPAEQQMAAIPPAPKPAGPRVETPLSVVFTSGSAIPADAASGLKDVSQRLAADPTLRVQLLSYASDPEKNVSRSRRLSLERAVAVRKQLIDAGVDSTRIEVRALGDQNNGGAADRVDIIFTARR